MKRVTIVPVVVLAILLLAPAQFGQTRGTDISTYDPRDFGISDPRPPGPISPVMTSFSSDTMQFVGFTEKLIGADEGVLNMSLACQQEFSGSRMCTVEEINRSIVIPNPSVGKAWVQNLSASNDFISSNCSGWMSASEHDLGTAIALGGDCFGGLKATPCNQVNSIACCATEGLMVQR